MRSRLSLATIACALVFVLPGIARAEIKLTPVAGSPITGVGNGGIIEPVDLNGDGLDDLAIGSDNPATGGVYVRLAQPDGSWLTRTTLESGSQVGDVVAADYDDDGNQDLLVHLPNRVSYLTQSDSFRVYLGNGDGTFAAPKSFGGAVGKLIVPPVTGQAIRPIDITGDGKLDLMMGLTRGQLGLALGVGDGTFTPVDATTFGDAPSGTTEGFGTVATGDFDGDGDRDVVLGQIGDVTGTSTVSNTGLNLLMGREDGSFESPSHVELPAPVGAVGSMTVGDLDDDGDDDIVANVLADSGTSTRLVVFPGGDAGIENGASLPSSPSSKLVGGSDLNGDGDLDLAWVDQPASTGSPKSNGLRILLGGTGATFAPAAPIFDLNFSPSQGFASALETGDFNGDGASDVVAGFRSADCAAVACGLSVLANRPVVTPASPNVAFGTFDLAETGVGSDLTLQNTGAAPARITGVVVTGPGSAAFTVPEPCQTVAPGSSCTMEVRLDRSAPGSYSATLRVDLAGVDAVSVPLSAAVAYRHAGFGPSSIEFGDHTLGTTPVSRTVTVTADGTDDIHLGQISLSGDGGQFQIAGDTCSGFTGKAGATCSIEVRTAVTKTGPIGAAIQIPNDGIDTPTTVPISVNGVPAPTYLAKLRVSGPAKIKPGKRAAFAVTASNTGTADLAGLSLKFKASQGRSVKRQGQVKLTTVSRGGSLKKAVPITLKAKGLKKGPVKFAFTLIRQGKVLATASKTSKVVKAR